VPTLLATLEKDLPELRFLLVSGEACPKDLVERWHKPERRSLNVYGPTEATVAATWTLLEPDKPVTIGVPLPTYSILILDPEENEARPLDQEGEIAIAGIGLANGYLNNQEKTDEAFIEDFLELADNPPGRIYRTGDLGKVNRAGELEHLGRIDTQVKIRGYPHRARGDRVDPARRELAGRCAGALEPREKGTVELGSAVSAAAFERGLLVETAGPQDEVVKLLPPLTIDDDELGRGLELLAEAVHAVC
jgi:hypothetical protein